MELAVGRSFWRSCGCLLAGLDERGLVWGCSEEFNEVVWGESGVSVGVVWQKK